ncbi:hypothetical protein CLU79DRAFT_831897 [Phycomyces nitens]|nr:hypothetical protein CLU79DRAFT_831897 [Phycomyces nitens]
MYNQNSFPNYGGNPGHAPQGYYSPNQSFSPFVNPSFSNQDSIRMQPSQERIPAETAFMYQRQPEGPILWFAGPPVNPTPIQGPAHSLAYLKWKQANQSS